MLAVFTATRSVKDPQGHVLFNPGEEIRWHADRWDQPIRVYREGRLARTFGPYHTPAIFVGLRDGSLARPEDRAERLDPGARASTRWDGTLPAVM